MKLDIGTEVSEEEADYLRESLGRFNEPFAGPTNSEQFRLAVRDENGKVTGGVLASCMWEWLYINVIWVSEHLRGQGYGSYLLQAAEKEGLKRNRNHALLHTFSFQARSFYERHGYKLSGELVDFPKGHSQFTMCKHLSSSKQEDR